ncbi:hypothetical protein HYALB_00009829 [Hymenoscyphus albidus]|uniref:NIMA interactive protein n=1 Tax=Hymenoscyphus albidus TaxID=595503 RepID=A0A9N9LV42_9HELO|nr:hypothetical protein HYALB_00009829 [Hymenoscyphus albidus]
MESDNLRTASLYINNQLLSRGLLRNGQTIDFARPEKGDGGVPGTMGRVMSVINDLILRRDRDATQRENLSQSIRTLRADSLRQTTEFERVSTKHMEAQRKLGLAEANDRALKQQIRSAETAAKGLKEEMAKMKLLVGQTRSSCANEIRKRERVIEGMKKHVGEGGRARGSGRAVGVMTVNVVAGVGGEKNSADSMGVDDTNYDLRMETNEFLTELARGLSEDNEGMNALLRRTVDTLKTLSGYDKPESDNGLVMETESGFETLAAEMDLIIDHLRHILTNPSFVPLEEVEVREEEILRLRAGWEKMESRWKEAVQMMDGWRRRMTRSGQTVNLEELKMGLSLSPSKTEEEEDTAPAFHQLSTLIEEGEGDTQADIDAMDDSGIPGQEDNEEADLDDEDSEMYESSLFEEEPVDEMSEQQEQDAPEEPSTYQHQDVTFASESSMSPGPPLQLSPLRETNTNGNRGSLASPQREGFSTIEEENTYDLLQLNSPSPRRKSKSNRGTPQPRHKREDSSTLPDSTAFSKSEPLDEISLISTVNISQRSPRKTSNPTPKSSSSGPPKMQPLQKLQQTPSSRLPKPRNNPPQQSPLTMASIAAKLAATEREADAARVRAKIKAAKLKRGAAPSTTTNTDATKLMPPPQIIKEEDNEPVKSDVSDSRKRKGTGRSQGGRANRRRSTLSPWELDSLITGTVGVSPSPKK